MSLLASLESFLKTMVIVSPMTSNEIKLRWRGSAEEMTTEMNWVFFLYGSDTLREPTKSYIRNIWRLKSFVCRNKPFTLPAKDATKEPLFSWMCTFHLNCRWQHFRHFSVGHSGYPIPSKKPLQERVWEQGDSQASVRSQLLYWLHQKGTQENAIEV